MGFFERALPMEEPRVRLLAEDPDLFEGLDGRSTLEARTRAIVPGLRLDSGPWDGSVEGYEKPHELLGLLIVDGLLVRTLSVAASTRAEVVGPGDLVRPWEEDFDESPTPGASRWTVVKPVRMAVLDREFLGLACRWPTVVSALVGRTLRRSESLSLQMTITDIRRVDERLMLLFWHLADRWGRVRRDGVLVPLPVTHELLAQLVGAQRPTVTAAVRRLSAEGRLSRLADKTWLMSHTERDPQDAAPEVRELAHG